MGICKQLYDHIPNGYLFRADSERYHTWHPAQDEIEAITFAEEWMAVENKSYPSSV